MELSAFLSLPRFGLYEVWPTRANGVRVTYCFNRCVECDSDIGGYEGVAQKTEGEPVMKAKRVYHPDCAPSALATLKPDHSGTTQPKEGVR